jgi:hypothetical protein
MSYIMCRYDSMRRKLAALIVKFLVWINKINNCSWRTGHVIENILKYKIQKWKMCLSGRTLHARIQIVQISKKQRLTIHFSFLCFCCIIVYFRNSLYHYTCTIHLLKDILYCSLFKLVTLSCYS